MFTVAHIVKMQGQRPLTFDFARPRVIWRSRMWQSSISSWRCEIGTVMMKYYWKVDVGFSKYANKFDIDCVILKSRKWMSHVASQRWQMGPCLSSDTYFIHLMNLASKKIDVAPLVGHLNSGWVSCYLLLAAAPARVHCIVGISRQINCPTRL